MQPVASVSFGQVEARGRLRQKLTSASLAHRGLNIFQLYLNGYIMIFDADRTELCTSESGS